jgi:hypothetical protein
VSIQAIHQLVVERLGAIESRRFERVNRAALRLLCPCVTASLLALLCHDICHYASLSEQALIVDDALTRSREEIGRKSSALVESNEAGDRIESLSRSESSGAGALEVINRIALNHGVHIDEMRSGVRCDSVDPVSRRQIQIVFRSSFSQLREFNLSLNNEVSVLRTESLVIERDALLVQHRVINTKICVSVVTKTS